MDFIEIFIAKRYSFCKLKQLLKFLAGSVNRERRHFGKGKRRSIIRKTGGIPSLQNHYLLNERESSLMIRIENRWQLTHSQPEIFTTFRTGTSFPYHQTNIVIDYLVGVSNDGMAYFPSASTIVHPNELLIGIRMYDESTATRFKPNKLTKKNTNSERHFCNTAAISGARRLNGWLDG